MSTIRQRPQGKSSAGKSSPRAPRPGTPHPQRKLPASDDDSSSTLRVTDPDLFRSFDAVITPTPDTSVATRSSSTASSKNPVVTLTAWAQAAMDQSVAWAPSVGAIAGALSEVRQDPTERLQMPVYDQLLAALASKGDHMVLATEARKFLNEHLPLRLEALERDATIRPEQALETLGRMRKLAQGRRHHALIGRMVVKYTDALRTARAARGSAGATRAEAAPAGGPATIAKDTYSWAVQLARASVGGDPRWSALRAISDSPTAAGVVVGVMGAALGRGTFAKVRPFVFASGQEPAEHEPNARYVARVTRTVRDAEKDHLRGADRGYVRYGTSTKDMVDNELKAMQAVGSELSPVASWRDDKGRRVDVVRYFERSFDDLQVMAPELMSNGAFVHDLCSSLLSQLEQFADANQVHLDIKPANILFDYARMYAVFGDFGFARTMGFDDFLGGTPRFMSPEMQRSEPLLVDDRSDLYSLAFSLASLMAPDELRLTSLYNSRAEHLAEKPSWQEDAFWAMARSERLIIEKMSDGPKRDRMWVRQMHRYASQQVQHKYEQWWIERFGSRDARFSVADLAGHDEPLDRLFTRLAGINPTVAQLVAAGLQGDASLRGSAAGWSKVFVDQQNNISADQRQAARARVAELAASSREKKRDNVFAQLKQFADRIDNEASVFSDSDDGSDDESPRGRSSERARH